MHRAALDGAGADEGDLDGEVVEGPGLQAGSSPICARDSTWNTPIESARQSMS